MKLLVFAGIFGACCSPALAADAILIPASSTTADIDLPVPPTWQKPAKIEISPLLDGKGNPVHPQPRIASEPANGSLKLHFEDMAFWGLASLQVETTSPDGKLQFFFSRGPLIDGSASVSVTESGPGRVWLYNPSASPMDVYWRLVSGDDKLCGAKSGADCDTPGNWQPLTIGPAGSDPVEFHPPPDWFHTFDKNNRTRQAQLELRFGPKAEDPVRRVPLTLALAFSSFWGRVPLVKSLFALAWRVLVTVFWVFVGAATLMMAQVMIPNFRLGLSLDEQLEEQEDRLRRVGSDIGNQIHARCLGELEDQRKLLPRAGHKKSLRARLLLSVNTADTKRLADALPRIDKRLQLIENLAEALGPGSDPPSEDAPVSLQWDRQQSLETIGTILARRTLSDADRKLAQDTLDDLNNPDTARKALTDGMAGRIAELKRLFPQPLTPRANGLLAQLPGCVDFLTVDMGTPSSWNSTELRLRDLAAIRLKGIAEILALPSLVPAASAKEAELIQLLQTDDPRRLALVRTQLTELSQGVTLDQVKLALTNGEYEVWSEPSDITEGDMVHVWLRFTKDDVEFSVAKTYFRCYWGISSKVPAADGSDACTQPEADWEEGWSTQFIPGADGKAGEIWVWPCIQDSDGRYITLPKRRDGSTIKGASSLNTSPKTRFGIRLFRGVIDALLTALVPVVTVAITQIGNGPDPGIAKLVTIGFTSQAIRSAIVPDK